MAAEGGAGREEAAGQQCGGRDTGELQVHVSMKCCQRRRIERAEELEGAEQYSEDDKLAANENPEQKFHAAFQCRLGIAEAAWSPLAFMPAAAE